MDTEVYVTWIGHRVISRNLFKIIHEAYFILNLTAEEWETVLVGLVLFECIFDGK